MVSMRLPAIALVGCLLVATVPSSTERFEATEHLGIRGHIQTLHVYGPNGGPPVIVSSGDGGWLHLAPHVAEALAASGASVVGFDVKAYLEGFTSGSRAVEPDDVSADYRRLIAFAARGSSEKPILIGVSEGAGLSVLAAADPRTRELVAGVVTLGLPDVNELGWRWRDALIYLTHGVPHEPTFRATLLTGRVSPAPLAMIRSAHDEFVSAAEARELFQTAREPKREWLVPASDHRFSDNLPGLDRLLMDAAAWVRGTRF